MTDPANVDPLVYHQQQLAQCEQKARDIALDLEVDAARRSLLDQEGWKKLQSRMGELLDQETERLLVLRMDGYQLGARQGFIRALRLLSREKPLSEAELAERRNEGKVLIDRIRELRDLTS